MVFSSDEIVELSRERDKSEGEMKARDRNRSE